MLECWINTYDFKRFVDNQMNMCPSLVRLIHIYFFFFRSKLNIKWTKSKKKNECSRMQDDFNDVFVQNIIQISCLPHHLKLFFSVTISPYLLNGTFTFHYFCCCSIFVYQLCSVHKSQCHRNKYKTLDYNVCVACVCLIN